MRKLPTILIISIVAILIFYVGTNKVDVNYYFLKVINHYFDHSRPIININRPFHCKSAFNTKIAASVLYSLESEPVTRKLINSKYNINSTNGWSFLVIKTKPEFRSYIVKPTANAITVNLPYEIKLPEDVFFQYRIPETSDGQLIVINELENISHEFYKFSWNDGKPTATLHKTNDLKLLNASDYIDNIDVDKNLDILNGLGHKELRGGTDNYIGTRASGIAGLAGLIRTSSLLNESKKNLGHALALELDFNQLSTEYQWPASSMDTTFKRNTGVINYGALIGIPRPENGGPNIEELKLTKYGEKIARTLVEYGAYVVDRRGNGSGFESDQFLPSKISREIVEDINNLKKYFRVVYKQQYNNKCN